MEELLGVLWAYKTTARKRTGVSPFTLTYGMEAIIPIEIGLPTVHTTASESANEESIVRELDTSDELREAVVTGRKRGV